MWNHPLFQIFKLIESHKFYYSCIEFKFMPRVQSMRHTTFWICMTAAQILYYVWITTTTRPKIVKIPSQKFTFSDLVNGFSFPFSPFFLFIWGSFSLFLVFSLCQRGSLMFFISYDGFSSHLVPPIRCCWQLSKVNHMLKDLRESAYIALCLPLKLDRC